MTTLYARVNPKTGIASFYRCAISFTQAWQKLVDIDEATARRLRQEQMLEVSTDKPDDFEERAPETDNAGSATPSAQAAPRASASPETPPKPEQIRPATSRTAKDKP